VADIVAVLLVPADGDPGGLLATGRFGSPPRVAACRGCGQWDHWGCAALWTAALPVALALWWSGDLVPEGWDRARRVHSAAPGRTPLGIAHLLTPSLAQAEMLGFDIARLGLASRVVRLARVDGRLVEVTP
jgi:hypothetical protein